MPWLAKKSRLPEWDLYRCRLVLYKCLWHCWRCVFAPGLPIIAFGCNPCPDFPGRRDMVMRPWSTGGINKNSGDCRCLALWNNHNGAARKAFCPLIVIWWIILCICFAIDCVERKSQTRTRWNNGSQCWVHTPDGHRPIGPCAYPKCPNHGPWEVVNTPVACRPLLLRCFAWTSIPRLPIGPIGHPICLPLFPMSRASRNGFVAAMRRDWRFCGNAGNSTAWFMEIRQEPNVNRNAVGYGLWLPMNGCKN